MEREPKFYVTTPIYYVNAEPHIGHAYTTVMADVLSRYHRMMGVPTFFLTGTDEHGQKVQRAAEKAGITPQEHADRTVVRFQELWKRLLVTNDDFIRTTEPRHRNAVQSILRDLYARGDIVRSEYDGWYCVTCERFFTEKDLADGCCPEPGCGKRVEPIKESNYFFRMSRYQDWLIDYIREHPRFIQPDFRRNETLGFLERKLNDLCISRPKNRLAWGIELPFDANYVTYVWFDALVNYISAIGYPSDTERVARWWPASCHLIGKDILTTHTVYWPTMLKAIGLPMPETVFAHGWWLAGRDKMSKTAGNVVDPLQFVERHGVDAFRYFVMAEMSMGQDAAFTEDAFVRRYNADLANDLGNLLSRVLKLIGSHCEGRMPDPGTSEPDDDALRRTVLAAVGRLAASLHEMRIDLGLAEIASAVREANRYLERQQPWALAKGGDAKRLGTVLYTACETLRIVSGALDPVMPAKMAEMRGQLGLDRKAPSFDSLSLWGQTPAGAPVGAVASLFPRIVSAPPEPPAAAPAEPAPSEPGLLRVEYADFQKIQLRTATILAAERVQGADKLLCLDIEVGQERRRIVAGIAKHYAPEDLPGRTILIVANLKPVRIRGIESNGMLLAASNGDRLRLVTLDGELPSGSAVK